MKNIIELGFIPKKVGGVNINQILFIRLWAFARQFVPVLEINII